MTIVLTRLRPCLRQPIPEIAIAAERLDHAATAHLRGDRRVAEELLRLANDKMVREWLEAAPVIRTRHDASTRAARPSPIEEEFRAHAREVRPSIRRLIHERDGYHCRFCKIPVIRREVRRFFQLHYPSAVPWGLSGQTQHAAFLCMSAWYDHILPNMAGGDSTIGNVYLACAACHHGRGNASLAECDLMHPGHHPPRLGPWDGLERVLRTASLWAPVARRAAR